MRLNKKHSGPSLLANVDKWKYNLSDETNLNTLFQKIRYLRSRDIFIDIFVTIIKEKNFFICLGKKNVRKKLNLFSTG